MATWCATTASPAAATTTGNGGISSPWGFKLDSGNVVSKNPKFVDRNAKDFRLQPGSPCEGIANGATGSTAARSGGAETTGNGNATPTTPQPTTTTHATRASVSVTGRRAKHGRVRLTGRVHRGLALQAAGVQVTKAVVQIRWSGAWYPLKTLRIKGGRFTSQFSVPASLRGHVLKLRVAVPTVGTSSTIKVRAR